MKTEFKIGQHMPSGYDISIGVGKVFYARDFQEVVYGLEHYFGKSVLNKPYDKAKHQEHAKECDCCPLCREG